MVSGLKQNLEEKKNGISTKSKQFFTTLEVERNKLGTLMKKEFLKFTFRTFFWLVGIIVLILLIGNLAYKNSWFFEKKYKPGPNKEIKEMLLEKGKLLNKETN